MAALAEKALWACVQALAEGNRQLAYAVILRDNYIDEMEKELIVILAPEARRVFPQRPHKVVFLDWSVPDPSSVRGTPAEVRAAYETTHQFIHEHIPDLVGAVHEENTR